MALLHTAQFYAGELSGSSDVTLFTVPTGYRYNVKRIAAQNMVASAKTLGLYIPGIADLTSLNLDAIGFAGSHLELSTWYVLNPGQSMKWAHVSGATFGLVVSGSQYTI